MRQYIERVGAISVHLILFLVLVLAAAPAQASAKSRPGKYAEDLSRPAGLPVLAVVALKEQRISIYDAEGRILRAPISTGQKGYETPAGIYSILERKKEHYSNLYDDASMPFMQRLTWSGIALHAGHLPGYPASHGCVRMPYKFAEELFDLTRRGMRVVVVRNDMRPVSFAHPALFQPGPIVSEVAAGEPGENRPTLSAEPISMHVGAAAATAGDTEGAAPTWRSIAAAKRAQADAAAKAADTARREAVKANAEIARSTRALRIAGIAKRKAEAHLDAIESSLREDSDRLSDERKAKLEDARIKALASFEAAKKQLEAAEAAMSANKQAADAAKETAKAAVEAKDQAMEEAKLAQAKTAPVSVFISRKTQRLYARQGFQPVFESDVSIRDADEPLGTFVFTAVAQSEDGAELRWNALAMYADPIDPDATRQRGGRSPEPGRTDTEGATMALERISIPQDTLDRIREVASAGSTLIVSDEALSHETGKGTDFVVVMSGEPQGGIKIRRRASSSGAAYRRAPFDENGYGRYYRRYPSPSRGLFNWW